MKKKYVYLVAMYEDAGGAFTVHFPDFPEMAADFGKNFDDAVAKATNFINDVVEYFVENNQSIPTPTRGEDFKKKLDKSKGEPFCMVPVTIYPPEKTERIQITTKGNIISLIDDFAKLHHLTRSELMINATLEQIKIR